MLSLPPKYLFSVLAVACHCRLGLNAEQPSAPAPAAGVSPVAAADYAAGFEKLRALGLPDAKGGAYVTFSSPMEYRERDRLLTGNAWVWEKGSNTPARVLTGLVALQDLADTPSGEGGSRALLLQRLQSRDAPSGAGQTTGTWKAADLQKDLEKVLAKLKESPDPNKPNVRHDDFLDWNGKIANPARWLFFAAHAHRSGLTNQANQVVQALFASQEDPRALLVLAVNQLAVHAYSKAWGRFLADGDWKAYSDGVDALLTRYGAAWKMHAGAQLLATRLKERERSQPAELQGPHLDEEAQRLAREIALATPQPPSTNTPPRRARMEEPETHWLWRASTNAPPADATAWQRLLHRGPAAIPALAALAGDPWLVRTAPEDSFSDSHSYSRRSMLRSLRGGSSSEEGTDAETQYQALERPRSRGEIAVKILGELFNADEPEEFDLSQASDESDDPVPALRKAALDWYAAHQKSAPDDIALHFLTQGNSGMRMQAGLRLISSTNAAHRTALETLLRDEEKFGQNQSLHRGYAAKFPDRAREILEEIAKKKGLDPDRKATERDSSSDYEERNLLMMLDALRPQDVGTLIKDLQTAKADSMGFYKLRGALQKADAATAYPQILQAAADNPNPEATAFFLNSLPTLFIPSAPGKTPGQPPPVRDHAEHWRKLLHDSRVVLQDQQSGQSVAMREANAAHFEELYTPRPASTNQVEEGADAFDYADWKSQNRPSVLVHLLGPAAIDLLRQRALARLEGAPEEQLPALPDAKKLPPARAEALAKLLSAGPVDAKAASEFTLEERLWIAGHSDESPDWPAHVTNTAHRVTRLELPNDAPAELRGLLQGWRDQVLSVERLQSLVKLLSGLPLAASNRQVAVLIERMPALQGVTVRVYGPDDARHPGRLLAAGGRLEHFFHASSGPILFSSGEWGFCRWPLAAAGPAKPAPAKPGEDEDLPDEDELATNEPESEDSFWEAVRAGLSGENDPFASGSQSFFVPHPDDQPKDEDSPDADL